MNVEEEISKISKFIKSGLVVLSLILVAGLLYYFGDDAVATVSSNIKNAKKLPIYCVDRDDNKVALSFDAAWGNDDTAAILEILAKHKVNVTFFMTGGWVESYPDDVKAIAAAGHDLGNHSENHKHMSELSKQQCVEEIMQVHNKVKELTGKDMMLFRPPYGDYNDTLLDAVKECNYHAIQWDVDSLDWKDYGVESIINTVVNHKHLGKGSIILCHNGAKYTKDALESLITGLQAKGYEIVPISKIIYTGEYEMDHEGRQHETGKKNEGIKEEQR